MCGRTADLLTADIEGVELKVCQNCAKYGKVKAGPRHYFKPAGRSFNKPLVLPKETAEFKVVDNFNTILRSAREKSNLNQEDFAKFLNEREHLIAKWEQGSLKPSLEEAKKIGRILGLSLIVKDDAEAVPLPKSKPDEFTLGDFVKVRKRM